MVTVTGIVTVGFVWLALHDAIGWSNVPLPAFVAASVLWIFFTYMTGAWVMRCRSVIDSNQEPETETSVDFSLDLVLTVFKFSLTAQVYFGIVVLAVLLWWLRERDQVSAWVVAAPVIILAAGHVLVGVFLKQPEVDPQANLILGFALLTHSVALTLKFGAEAAVKDPELQLGHSFFEALPWSFCFLPSWITYCAIFATSRRSRKAEPEPLELVRFVGWLAAWTMLLCAQVFLTLRLDGVWQAPWALILLPVVAAILLFASVCGPEVASRVHRILVVVLDASTIPWEEHPSYATFDPPDAEPIAWPAPVSMRSASSKRTARDARDGSPRLAPPEDA